MQELTPEQIAAAEKELQNHTQHGMKKVRDFLNQPIKDKHGKEKSMSMHMRTEYIADALDELHERTKNSISMHAYQTHQALSDLFNQVEKIKMRLDKLEGKNQSSQEELK